MGMSYETIASRMPLAIVASLTFATFAMRSEAEHPYRTYAFYETIRVLTTLDDCINTEQLGLLGSVMMSDDPDWVGVGMLPTCFPRR